MKNFGMAISEWMDEYKKNSVKPSTFDRLKTSYDLMSKYDVFYIPLDKASTSDIQAYLNDLTRDGYALSTIKKQYHLISEFVTYANLNEMMRKQINRGVRLPAESAVKKRRKEVVAYTKDEQERLRGILMRGESPAYYAAIMMFETGARVGEVLALSWTDIDWRRKAVRISKTIVRLGNSRKSYVQNEAKSYTSNRTIPLSSTAYDLLELMRKADSFDGYIFHNKYGSPLTYEALRWWIRKACDEANVPYYGQHVFRHTFATNCYDRGCDVKMLSKLLGHSDVTITFNVYIHLFGDALEEMRSVIG